MAKSSKIVEKFLEKLHQTVVAMDNLSTDLEDEADCKRDQAVLVVRGCLQLSKYVKTAAEYLGFLNRSAKDRTEEVKAWQGEWKLLKEKMDESCRYMKGISWSLDECSYKGSEYYIECLDAASAYMVHNAGEHVKAFCVLKRNAEELARSARGMMKVWKSRLDDMGSGETNDASPSGTVAPEGVEEIAERIKGCFFGVVEEAMAFLERARGMKNKDITSMVTRGVNDKKISGMSHHRDLWQPLFEAGIYTASESNWNRLVPVRTT